MLNRLPAKRKLFLICRRSEERPAIGSRRGRNASAARREAHAAIDIFIGRDAKIVGCRVGCADDHGHRLWRAVDHARCAQGHCCGSERRTVACRIGAMTAL